MDHKKLKVGVNLGGWLSQYSHYDHAHFRTFITADDIRRIADWGMDHVRLPVDYPVLEDDNQVGEYKADGFEYIDACIEWCRENGLKVVLDLHHAPGYSFTNFGASTLFSETSSQTRLANLWTAIAKRYAHFENDVAYELLNEVVLPDSTAWNSLYPQLLSRVREVAPGSLVIVGGNHYNAADQLKNLVLVDDSNLLYTFHYYLPMVVTHYHAAWVPWLTAYDKLVSYPGEVLPAGEGFREIFDLAEFPELEPGTRFDQDYLKNYLRPAIEFMHRSGKNIYCGEFGVIDQAPLSNRLNRTHDFISLLVDHEIGRAFWCYKAMDFGLVDTNGTVISDGLVRIACMR